MTEFETSNWQLWILLLAAAAAAAWLALSIRRWVDVVRRKRRARIAGRGERAARRLLERAGFRIVAEQAIQQWLVAVDDQTTTVVLRADYLVRRGRQSYVAEVKSGSIGNNVIHGPTRRQLLEYQLAFRTDGVLLVDARTSEVREVTFLGLQPGLASPTARPRMRRA